MIARNESQRCASEAARLEGEARALHDENSVLATELERMHATLRTLEQAHSPGSEGVVELSAEQRARYEELKREYEEKACSVLQADETARRSHETLESELRQKSELIASHQQELESTKKVVQELRGQLSRLSTSKSDCERVVKHLEEESAGLQNEYARTSEALRQKREASETLRQRLQSAVDAQEGKNKKAERKAVVRRLQGLFPEVKGLLVDLVNATQRKWA